MNHNRPYIISGDVEATEPDGNKYSWTGSAMALCRCGEPSNKPFCDGAHKECGFESAPRP